MSRKDELFAVAVSAREKAYAPYSNFAVGAAVLDEFGKIHGGCNIENAAYPEGSCAEANAIGHLIMEGGSKITEVLVVADAVRCSPCGGCRQKLLEFGSVDVPVHIADLNGIRESHTIGSLLPVGFQLNNQK